MRVAPMLAILAAGVVLASTGIAYAATADSAFLDGDGIGVPIPADQSPGHERLSDTYKDSALLTGKGKVRLRRLLGSDVVDTSGQQLGSVSDVLVNGSGEPQVIVESNGRLVEVPWSKLAFGLPGNELHGNVVLPGETRHALEELPEFKPKAAGGHG